MSKITPYLNFITKPLKTLFSKRIPFYYIITFGIICIMISYFIGNSRTQSEPLTNNNVQQSQGNDQIKNSCIYILQRLNGYKFIKPLLMADPECESDKLASIKNSISTLIGNYKTAGELNWHQFI